MVKKIIAFGIILVIVFSSVGCVSNPNKPKGYFYSLEEAYEQGLVTQQDLKNMAYYKKEDARIHYEEFYLNENKDFNPAPKNPESLSREVKEKIKQAYVNYLSESENLKALAEDVTVYDYYGTYNGCTVVMMSDKFHSYNGDIWTNYDSHFIGLNTEFVYPYIDGIYIWKNGQNEEFYNLKTAYTLKLLTNEDLENIAYYQKTSYEKTWRENILMPVNQEELSEETIIKIKQTRLDEYKAERHDDGTLRYPDITIDDISIGKYYGTYNGCVALFYGGGWFSIEFIVIADVLFIYPYSGEIIIWKENK